MKIRTQDINTEHPKKKSFGYHIKFVLLGIWFGVLLVKGEVLSWFRIQEMFRLESFHMYGVIGSAIVIGAISIFLIKKFRIKSLDGELITTQPKIFKKGQIFGGFIFGLGWAMTGACPGPLYANFGYGYSVFIVAIFSAIIGTYVYGLIKDKLPN